MFKLCCVPLLVLYHLQGILLTNTKIYVNSLDINPKGNYQQLNNTYKLNNLQAEERKLKFFKVFKKGAKLGPKQKKTFKFITKKLPQLYQQFAQPIYQPAPPVKYKQRKKKKGQVQCIPLEYLQRIKPQSGNRYKDYEYVFDDEDDEDSSVLNHPGSSEHGHYVQLSVPIPSIPLFHPYRRMSVGNNRMRRFWRILPPSPPPSIRTVPQIVHKLIKTASIPPKTYGLLNPINTPYKPLRISHEETKNPPFENHQVNEKYYSNITRHYYSSKYRNESMNINATEPPLNYHTTKKPIPTNPIIFGVNKALNASYPQLFQPSMGQQTIAYNKNYVNNLHTRNMENYFNTNRNFGSVNVTVPKVIYSPTTTEPYRNNGMETWRAMSNYNTNIYFTGNGASAANKTSFIRSYEVNEDFMEISTQPQFLLKPKNRN